MDVDAYERRPGKGFGANEERVYPPSRRRLDSIEIPVVITQVRCMRPGANNMGGVIEPHQVRVFIEIEDLGL